MFVLLRWGCHYASIVIKFFYFADGTGIRLRMKEAFSKFSGRLRGRKPVDNYKRRRRKDKKKILYYYTTGWWILTIMTEEEEEERRKSISYYFSWWSTTFFTHPPIVVRCYFLYVLFSSRTIYRAFFVLTLFHSWWFVVRSLFYFAEKYLLFYCPIPIYIALLFTVGQHC